MPHLRSLLVIVALSPGIHVGAAFGQPSESVPVVRDSSLRNRLICGPNVLYMLLKLHGRPVTYEQTSSQLSTGDRGTSMLQLRDAATRLSLPVRIRRCKNEDLSRCTMPLIAHFYNSFLQGDAIGHYVVVLRVDDETVEFIDGTVGDVVRYQRKRFPTYWSGYILEPYEGIGGWGRQAGVVGLGGLVVIGLGFLWKIRTKASRVSKIVAGLLLIFVATSAYPSPAAAAGSSLGSSDSLGIWRTLENDGVNCLYLQLSVEGRPVDYARVKAAIRPERSGVSLVTLREAARNCGLRMRILKCGPGELARMPMPVITYIHGLRGGGGFALIYQMGKERCALIKGATAIIKEVPIDDFRRDWCGFVLAPEPPYGGWLPSAVVCFAAVAGYTCLRMRTVIKLGQLTTRSSLIPTRGENIS